MSSGRRKQRSLERQERQKTERQEQDRGKERYKGAEMGARMGTARRPGESEEKRRRGGRGETDFPKPGTSQMTHQRQGCSEGSQGHPLNLGHGHVGNEGDVAEMSGLQSPRAQEVGWAVFVGQALETLSECVIKSWVTGRQGRTMLRHSPNPECQ